jgi:hypothetical protein
VFSYLLHAQVAWLIKNIFGEWLNGHVDFLVRPKLVCTSQALGFTHLDGASDNVRVPLVWFSLNCFRWIEIGTIL